MRGRADLTAAESLCYALRSVTSFYCYSQMAPAARSWWWRSGSAA